MNLVGYSQRIIFIDPDTLTCFTKTESKFLLLSYYKGEEASDLLDNCEQLSTINISLLKEYKTSLDNRNKVILLKDSLILLQDKEIVNTKQDSERERKKKKIWRSFVFIISPVVVLETMFLYKQYGTKAE